MTFINDSYYQNGIRMVRMESEFLSLEVAPELGGKITSLIEKKSGQEFLWRNESLSLKRYEPGTIYDPNFYGGIDELIPTDSPEHINGADAPDHGELWTTPLEYRIEDDSLIMEGRLQQIGFTYNKSLKLRADAPQVDVAYRIANYSFGRKVFLWKMHAALLIEPGDVILCPARKAQVADTAWSRWKSTEPFLWPLIGGKRADVIPERDGGYDFFYLYDLEEGIMGLMREFLGLEFVYCFDKAVFPYPHYFASYGPAGGIYTAVIEPSTTMPYWVHQAEKYKQCSVLNPGEILETSLTIYAGPIRRKLS